MHTTRGLAASLDYLKDTGVGSRRWIMGTRVADVGGFGWSHIRDDGEEGAGEEREARSGRMREETAEAAGVG